MGFIPLEDDNHATHWPHVRGFYRTDITLYWSIFTLQTQYMKTKVVFDNTSVITRSSMAFYT